jgi:thiol-disulfide isomerase/thioredoxin
MKTRTIGIVIVVAVVVVAAVLAIASRDSSSGGASAGGSSSGTSFAGPIMAPDEFAVADFAGKPLVINLFGSWCPPCNAEAPDLATFAAENPDAQVVGIACEDTEEGAVGFMEEYGLTYPLVMDDGTLVQEFGIPAYPTTIFFDAQGNEVDRLVGSATLDQFTASLAKAQ